MTKLPILSGLTLLLIFVSEFVLAQQEPTELSGFSSEEIFEIQDGEPLAINDKNLARLLYRVQQTSNRTLTKFSESNREINLGQINRDPRSYHGYIFKLAGFINKIHRFQNPTADSDSPNRIFELLEFESADNERCLVVVPDKGRPRRWPQKVPISEPVEFVGFFLAKFDFHTDASNGSANVFVDSLQPTDQLVFVAKKVAWFPGTGSEKFPVTESELLLSRHGVDIAQLDGVRGSPTGPLGPNSADSFYQMLNATRKISLDQFPRETVDFKECLQHPAKFQSSPLKLTGQIRRITEIPATDSYFMDPGVSHYFQLDMFVALEGHDIVFRAPNAPEGKNKIVHKNRFPVTVCVTELPLEKKEMQRRNVVVPCFFFKRWSYVSEQSAGREYLPFQDAPLAIGLKPIAVAEPANPLNFWIGAFSVLCILTLGALYLLFGRPTTFSVAQSGRRDGLPTQIEIDL